MARSTRSGGKHDTPSDEAPPADAGPDDRRPDDAADPAVPAADARPDDTSIPDAEVVDVTPPRTAVDPAPETPVVAEAPPAGDPVAPVAPETTPPVTPATAAAPDRPAKPPLPAARPSVVPLVLGGVVAAALGYAAAWTDVLPRPPDAALTARVDALAASVEALTARPVEDAAARARLDAVEQAQATAAGDLAAGLGDLTVRADGLSSAADALADRLTALENRPQVTVALSEQAQAAVEAQIAALRQEAADGIARVEQDRAALAAQADERLSALEADLRGTLAMIESERAALEAARAAAAAEVRASRLAAAVADLRAALDAGTPYAAPLGALADLVGTPPPEVLTARAEDGIPSLAALRDAFPEAARAALEQVLRAQVAAGEVGRVEGFMRIQSGVRSLTPQDGDDADAVLSRAEAALAAGDLAGALTLVAALPEPGRTAMQGWADLAQVRRAALDALAGYGNS
ncbi:MAG: hypothetical protein MUF73_10115 [Rhodobacteraceae bacterium]|nr:hypothetical protein [Paracoccaceae bacterium]